MASSSADGDNRKVPKPWWEALARLAFELRGEAAAQRAAHTTDLGILQQQQLALRARARIDKLQNAADSGGGGSTLALSGAALGAVASGLAAAVVGHSRGSHLGELDAGPLPAHAR